MSEPLTIANLTDELVNGPHAATLAPLLLAGLDDTVAAILNDLAGAHNGTVIDRFVSKNDFLAEVTAPASLALATKDATTQAKWDRVIQVIVGAVSFDMQNPTVLSLLNLAVADGLLTQDQINTVGSRTGSRAEVRWGPGTIISAYAVSQAR